MRAKITTMILLHRIGKDIGIGLLYLSLVVLSVNDFQKAQAQIDTKSEYKFKAVYLYNFLQFVEWPQQAFRDNSSPIVVGVLGNEMLSSLLEQTIKNETIKARDVVVDRLSNTDEIKPCHMLFISRAEEKNLAEILSKIKNKPILTVSEAEDFTTRGGAINFYFEDKKLRFEINLEAIKKANLVLSSKLLRLAKIVSLEN